MAHMLFQHIATSVREAYAGRQDVEAQFEAAGAYPRWADSLAVDAGVRAVRVEPIAAMENGLREVLGRRSDGTG